MALIDELKQRRETAMRTLAQIEQRIADENHSVARVTEGISDLDRAIAALEAPAQPLDELRTDPGSVEEVRDQSVTVEADWPTPPDAETTIADSVLTAFEDDHIVERAPVIDAQTCEEVDPRVSWKADDWTPTRTDAQITVADLDNLATKASPEERAEMGEETLVTDLWQQGYDDKANGYEPSLAEPEYTKGYEARALIEREHRETMERAKFFDGGMMADADRHAQDQRGIVDRLTGMFKREREDA